MYCDTPEGPKPVEYMTPKELQACTMALARLHDQAWLEVFSQTEIETAMDLLYSELAGRLE